MSSYDAVEVHVTWLEGIGASYRIKGYFILDASTSSSRFEFDGVAFGGNYGGHNVNVQIGEATKKELMESRNLNENQIEDLISEVQRKMLNNEMVVEYDKLKPEKEVQDPFTNLGPKRQ